VALACSCLLALAPLSARAFGSHGEWIAITVCLALEANVGATMRKASLRAGGTVLGGALGTACVALTAVLSGGWSASAANLVRRVAVMTTLVSCSGAAVQLWRVRSPPTRDYAFAVCLVTLCLTSLSAFTSHSASLRAALLAVGSRLAAIAVGGCLAFFVAVLVSPEYAAHEARELLASLLRDASALLSRAVEAHLEASLDGAFEASNREQHALEARTSKALERLGVLIGQSEEERLLCFPAASQAGCERAGAACRAVFTSAVSLLHSAEAGLAARAAAPPLLPHIAAARQAMLACFARAAERTEAPPGRAAAAGAAAQCSLTAFEAAVESLAGEMAAMRLPASAGGGLRRSVQALGALVFSLGDAAAQARAALAALGEGEAGEGEKRARPRWGGGMGEALRGAARAVDAWAAHTHVARHGGGELQHAASEPALGREHR